jgi:hypothetical protein
LKTPARLAGVFVWTGRAGSIRQLTNGPGFLAKPKPAACVRTKTELCSSYVLKQEEVMLRVFVEEAAALASIGLFVGMVAIWAQLIPQF